LAELIASSTGVARKIYEAAKTSGYKDSDKPPKELTDLVELIGKVVAGTDDASTLTKLKEYKAATDAADEKKKAWDIANQVPGEVISGSTEGAGAEALKKLEDGLAKAKKAAQDAMKDESGAYKAIEVESLEDRKLIEKITEIFTKAKEA
jgi:hypothetical protein